MHRCLQISEILHNILENLAVATCLRDLLAVALVSKTFCEPALDALWVFQDSLPLLIKTFPRDLWIELGNPKKLTFQRLLTKSDLDRYLFYGKKMRELRVVAWNDRNTLSQIDSSVFHTISIFLDLFHPGRIVLPHLRQFYCQSHRLDSIWEIIPYLSPSLQQIELDAGLISPRNLSVFGLLSTLASKSPFVKRLFVNGRILSMAYYPPILFTSPCGFLHLSTFKSPDIPLSRDAVGHLAHLPNLYDVSLRLSGIRVSNLSTLAMPPRPFPSLRELNLNLSGFVPGIEFIRTCLPSVSLNSIDICTDYDPSPGQIHQLFLALSSHLFLQSLTSVFLHNAGDDDYEDGPTLESTDFEPLLRFNNLESLHLDIAFSLEHLSDSLLEAFSLSWPQLTKLDFDSRLYNVHSTGFCI